MKLTKIISYIHLLGCIGWSYMGFCLLENNYPLEKSGKVFLLFALFATTASGIYLFIVGRKKQPENIKIQIATLMTKIISYIHLLGCIGWLYIGFYFLKSEEGFLLFLLFTLFVTTTSGIYLYGYKNCNFTQIGKVKLIILWAGTSIIVAMCLETLYERPGMDYLVRLVIQCVIVGLITGALLYTLNNKKAEGGEK